MAARDRASRSSSRSDGVPLTNIRTIAKLEQEHLHRRSARERLGDRIAALAGSGVFAVVHVAIFATWIAINVGRILSIPPFDPYPFNFLTMAVSLEAIFITIAVLSAQNRMACQSDRRAQLELQINLLAEQESTATLRLLERIAERLGVKEDEPLPAELAETTDVEKLATQLERKLPEP